MNQTTTVLVTGGTGFVGMQIILQLLQRGYTVRTTVRNLNNKDKLINTLKDHGITFFDRLSFAEAELTRDDNWAEAMRGCTYVLSVASPVFLESPENEQEAIRPAVEGILRVLRFARKEGVKRVVMTSNFGAVGFSHTDKTTETTEADWTDITLKGLSIYEKSKTLAEQAAREFIKNEGGPLEFATINPVAILGPSLDAHISGSFHLLEALLHGTMKAVPHIPLNVVDVRDVADLHIRAMLHPDANGGRFIATTDGQISFPEIAALLRSKRPQVAGKVSARTIPNWMLRLAALVNPKAREAVMLLNVNRRVSNANAKKILGWTPVATQEQAILAAVDSMIRYGHIQ
ncbi:SDR family oxidoreductase [Arsenicibacter rosenii]|uniref:Aldehyde reductase n=1 Tax=Arsenicibacter rosenii TaxID=1750698 RepID=A0A1S2VDI1_9BACT|nr:aldehyde reductase [Arsenicibacter rosenii]OIN56749.1 aldehyde reductase [Arsenicibacter rosenii]